MSNMTKKYLTYKELVERFGWSQSFFYKHAHLFQSARLKINGVARRPYRFDIEMIERLISTDQAGSEPASSLTTKYQELPVRGRRRKNQANAEVNDLWQ